MSGGGADWIRVVRCPACDGEGRDVGALFKQSFNFGGARAPNPPEPVRLRECSACGLIFKSVMAGPALLTRLTSATQDSLWRDGYGYAPEKDAARAVAPDALEDVIDVGAAGGEFLAALPPGRRRSALDIVRFDGLKISGEFIQGVLDDPDMRWSGEPYGLVSLFDVAEHLYHPQIAFRNLRALCRTGGLVMIETGDSDAVPRARLPIWYYLNLLEHHIAWNRRSLERAIAAHRFEIVSFERKPHKSVVPPTGRQKLKLLAFRLAPRLLDRLYALRGRSLDVPAQAVADHMRVILRAV
jgi:SAM-dependent methyltransferase